MKLSFTKKYQCQVHIFCSLVAIVTLVCMLVLTPIVSIFGTDSFYHYAYERNSAYEQLDNEFVWLVTKNFQAFLEGSEELVFFDSAQSSHLQDVKELYQFARFIIIVSMLIHILCVLFVMNPVWYSQVLIRSAIIVFFLILILALLALNWQWFFTQFHIIFFDDNWQFSPSSLVIRLWGGSFFIFAAVYSALQSILISALLFVIGKMLLITGNQS